MPAGGDRDQSGASGTARRFFSKKARPRPLSGRDRNFEAVVLRTRSFTLKAARAQASAADLHHVHCAMQLATEIVHG
jgi:hypothetical protein